MMAYSALEESNRRIAIEAYEKVIIPFDSSCVEAYFSPNYIQHSTLAADGVTGLKTFLDWARTEHPLVKSSIKRVFADGDYVIFHVHVVLNPGEPGVAAIDIFRMENNKIAEHWDILQPVPAEQLNKNGMF